MQRKFFFSNYISNKELESRMHNEFLKPNNKKIMTWLNFKKMAKVWRTDNLQKKKRCKNGKKEISTGKDAAVISH